MGKILLSYSGSKKSILLKWWKKYFDFLLMLKYHYHSAEILCSKYILLLYIFQQNIRLFNESYYDLIYNNMSEFITFCIIYINLQRI